MTESLSITGRDPARITASSAAASRTPGPALRTLFAAAILAAASACAQAPTAESGFKPQVGQAGKDVIWVPTSQALVDRMLDMARVTPKDFVIDLGSGDGRTVITAARRGATAMGIEYNPEMVDLSRRNAASEGVSDRATFVRADLFESDLSRANVITMFLLPSINLKLRPKILDLAPGTRVVSNSFTMGEWKDDDTQTIDEKSGCSYYCTAHLWIVPAKVAGIWTTPQGELSLRQEFQMLSGTLRTGGKSFEIGAGRMRGSHISFIAGGVQYAGEVSDNAIAGTSRAGSRSEKWSATRAAR